MPRRLLPWRRPQRGWTVQGGLRLHLRTLHRRSLLQYGVQRTVRLLRAPRSSRCLLADSGRDVRSARSLPRPGRTELRPQRHLRRSGRLQPLRCGGDLRRDLLLFGHDLEQPGYLQRHGHLPAPDDPLLAVRLRCTDERLSQHLRHCGRLRAGEPLRKRDLRQPAAGVLFRRRRVRQRLLRAGRLLSHEVRRPLLLVRPAGDDRDLSAGTRSPGRRRLRALMLFAAPGRTPQAAADSYAAADLAPSSIVAASSS